MKTTNPCRCSECSGKFIPDPRVRCPVTCGAEACQRARHAKQCRKWHAANRESGSNHYQDVIVPFRKRQPDYQRRWRWWKRLREIRERSAPLTTGLLLGLRDLVTRALKLSRRGVDAVQTGVLAGKKLARTVAVVQRTIAAIEELQASTAELEELGL